MNAFEWMIRKRDCLKIALRVGGSSSNFYYLSKLFRGVKVIILLLVLVLVLVVWFVTS